MRLPVQPGSAKPATAKRPGGPRARRPGLSLLEVLVALAIFFLSIVVISQMVDQASRTAQKAAHLTKASLHAETVMSELMAGIRPLANSGQEQIQDDEQGWVVTVQAQPEAWTQMTESVGTGYGLHLVHVMVSWQNAAGYPETEYTLTRVMMDPGLKQSLTIGVPTPPPDAPAASSSTSGTGGSR